MAEKQKKTTERRHSRKVEERIANPKRSKKHRADLRHSVEEACFPHVVAPGRQVLQGAPAKGRAFIAEDKSLDGYIFRSHPSAMSHLKGTFQTGDAQSADAAFCRWMNHRVMLDHKNRPKELPEDVPLPVIDATEMMRAAKLINELGVDYSQGELEWSNRNRTAVADVHVRVGLEEMYPLGGKDSLPSLGDRLAREEAQLESDKARTETENKRYMDAVDKRLPKGQLKLFQKSVQKAAAEAGATRSRIEKLKRDIEGVALEQTLGLCGALSYIGSEFQPEAMAWAVKRYGMPAASIFEIMEEALSLTDGSFAHSHLMARALQELLEASAEGHSPEDWEKIAQMMKAMLKSALQEGEETEEEAQNPGEGEAQEGDEECESGKGMLMKGRPGEAEDGEGKGSKLTSHGGIRNCPDGGTKVPSKPSNGAGGGSDLDSGLSGSDTMDWSKVREIPSRLSSKVTNQLRGNHQRVWKNANAIFQGKTPTSVDGLSGFGFSDWNKYYAPEKSKYARKRVTSEVSTSSLNPDTFQLKPERCKWGKMTVDKPKLTHETVPPKDVGRGYRKSAHESGRVPNNMHRWASDMRIFSRKRHRKGGLALLCDCSGSMSLSVNDIDRVLDSVPASIIGCYSGGYHEGKLRVVAKNGRRVKRELVGSGAPGGNCVDFPALQWLAAQQNGGKYWLSDGLVTGIDEDINSHLAMQVHYFCMEHDIYRVPSIAKLFKVIFDGEELGPLGMVQIANRFKGYGY